jgi:hypothetical protein
MTLVVLITAGTLFSLYFRGRPVSASEALQVGLLWLGVNLALDYPMFSYGPMKLAPSVYFSQIGLDYLTFPAFGFWTARLARR